MDFLLGILYTFTIFISTPAIAYWAYNGFTVDKFPQLASCSHPHGCHAGLPGWNVPDPADLRDNLSRRWSCLLCSLPYCLPCLCRCMLRLG